MSQDSVSSIQASNPNTQPRIQGKPLSAEERATRSNTQLVQNINRSIRTDFGQAKDVGVYIADTLRNAGALQGVDVDQGLFIASVVHNLLRKQVEGIRTRTSHDREELLRRFEQQDRKQDSERKGFIGTLQRIAFGSKEIEAEHKEAEARIDEEYKALSILQVTNIIGLNNKIQKILNWAVYHPDFNRDFVNSMERALLNRGSLSEAQERGLDNIITGFKIGQRPPDETRWMDSDNVPEYD